MASAKEDASGSGTSLEEIMFAVTTLCGFAKPVMRDPNTNLPLSGRAAAEHLALN